MSKLVDRSRRLMAAALLLPQLALALTRTDADTVQEGHGSSTHFVRVAQAYEATGVLRANAGAPSGTAHPSLGSAKSAGAPSFPRPLLDDVRFVLGAPVRWTADDWTWVGLGTGVVVLTSALLDNRLRDATLRRQSSGTDRALTDVERLGSLNAGVLIPGAMWGYGALTGDAGASSTGQDMLAATLIASGIVTPALQYAVGRARPRTDEGASHFRPFGGGSDHGSFPSGHATQAYTLAAVLSAHYPSPWVLGMSYGTATIVGYARIYHQAHWASDVLASALIGTAVGYTVVHYNEAQRTSNLSIVPGTPAGTSGLTVRWTKRY